MLPRSDRLPHDLIDPRIPGARTELVTPVLIEMIGRQPLRRRNDPEVGASERIRVVAFRPSVGARSPTARLDRTKREQWSGR